MEATQLESAHLTGLLAGQVVREEQNNKLCWQLPSGQRTRLRGHETAVEQALKEAAQRSFSHMTYPGGHVTAVGHSAAEDLQAPSGQR